MISDIPRMRRDVRASRDQRFAGRRPASIGAKLKSTAIGQLNVTISDISETGCRLDVLSRLNKGQTVVLRIDGLDPIGGTVQWQRYGVAGIRFRKKLNGDIVRRLIDSLSRETSGED